MTRRNRRQFLQVASAAAVVPYLVPRSVFATADQPGANDTAKIAIIGWGGRAQGIYHASVRPAKGAKVVACSDIFQPRQDSFLKQSEGTGANAYYDFREMIEKEKPDGVMVETATHQRAWIAGQVMQMGAHLYIEKPMCLTISEGRYLVNMARKHKRVTQVGTQQRSLPLCNWASDMIQNGAIGKIKVIEVPNFIGPNVWTGKDGVAMPEGCRDGWWDLWTNQAEMRPYHPELHYGWSNWWDYDAGGQCFGVSGWGTHSFDQANRVLGANDYGPLEILLEEECTIQDSGKFSTRTISEDETGAEYYGMAKVVGPRAKIKMFFPNDIEMWFHLDGDRGPGLGCIVKGETGKIEINRHKVASNPKELVANVPEEAKNLRDETVYHVENWIECMNSGATCNADIEYGQRSTTLCDLVNIVRKIGRVGERLKWDSVNERFTNCDEGNAMLSRPRRKGFELPEIG